MQLAYLPPEIEEILFEAGEAHRLLMESGTSKSKERATIAGLPNNFIMLSRKHDVTPTTITTTLTYEISVTNLHNDAASTNVAEYLHQEIRSVVDKILTGDKTEYFIKKDTENIYQGTIQIEYNRPTAAYVQ